jgi:hypothetical protein
VAEHFNLKYSIHLQTGKRSGFPGPNKERAKEEQRKEFCQLTSNYQRENHSKKVILVYLLKLVFWMPPQSMPRFVSSLWFKTKYSIANAPQE